MQTSDAANGQHERLALEGLLMEQAGFIYVYVSNETNADINIFFDDLQLTHTYTPVVVSNEYYPFGMEMEARSYSREDYRFDYQGLFAEKDKETGWNAFELRMYDANIGRWLSMDPYGQYASPYMGMGNNPGNSVDPDGGFTGCPSCIDIAWTGGEVVVTASRLARVGRELVGIGGSLSRSIATFSSSRTFYNIPNINPLPSVQLGAQNGGPASERFHFFDKSNEGEVYKLMLEIQEVYGVESAAYLAKNKNGVEGILLLPWAWNRKNKSESYLSEARNGEIYNDSDKSFYRPLVLVHTHPDNDPYNYQPSVYDVDHAIDLGIPHYILTNAYYTEINTSIPYDAHRPTGVNSLLWNTPAISLFPK